jgi:peptide/nickel transport system substrate-binding protein
MRRAVAGVLLLAAVGCRVRQESPAPAQSLARPTPQAAEPGLEFLDGTKDGAPQPGGTLYRRLAGEPTTLNAVLQSGVFEAQVLQYVQRNLFDYDAKLDQVPGLAEKLEVSPDGREYVVTLKADAVWEDGKPVTSRDVVFTVEKIHDPKVPAPVFKSLFEDLEKAEALDARRARFRFRQPYAFRAMAFVLPVLPEHRFTGQRFLSAKDNRSPLSNGPYRLVKWKTQESLELERNPRYPWEKGAFDRILFRIVPDNATAFRLLTSGELDEDQLDAGQKAKIEALSPTDPCCRLVEFYNLDFNYIALNSRSPLFSDARVRRAMTMLLDRASLVRDLYRGSARIISGPWAPDSPAYDASVEPLPFDPGQAKKLLAEAGWGDTNGSGTLDREGREFEFDLLVAAGSDIGRQIDEMLAAELAKVGVTAHVRQMEWSAFVAKVDAGDFEGASLGWSSVDANPDPYFYWHSSQCPPNGQNNGCYRSAEADRLMEEARSTLDAGKRKETFHRLHRIFRDDAPAIFVVNPTQKFAFTRAIRGVTTSPLGLYGIWPGPLGWWKKAS